MPGVLAQFSPRFCGAFIDALVYFLAAIPFFVVAVAVFIAGGALTDDNGAGGGLLILLGFVLFIGSGFVPVVLQARALSRSGQTIGCRAMGVKVVKIGTGQPLQFWPAVGRVLFASFASGQVCYLGYLWMLWDDKKQTWHDKILDTVVIEA
jgi:uncharacterized RDD family membrane protein YckC